MILKHLLVVSATTALTQTPYNLFRKLLFSHFHTESLFRPGNFKKLLRVKEESNLLPISGSYPKERSRTSLAKHSEEILSQSLILQYTTLFLYESSFFFTLFVTICNKKRSYTRAYML
jgi:hypothetical protein